MNAGMQVSILSPNHVSHLREYQRYFRDVKQKDPMSVVCALVYSLNRASVCKAI